ncbi:MAG TPA: hypothetical protein VN914_07460 [Polyangia bacterium]|nr:hypothetical protein [Polyangia bacterium]
MTEAEDHAAFLERVRTSGIRIDREGRLWHQGQTVDHAGLRAALFRWLDRNPDGRYVFRLDAQRFANVEVVDTPLVARSARWQGEGVLLVLSDGSEERLDPGSLTIDGDGVLRCQVRGGRLEARLSTSAAAVLAERIEGDRLRVDGRLVTIPPR